MRAALQAEPDRQYAALGGRAAFEAAFAGDAAQLEECIAERARAWCDGDLDAWLREIAAFARRVRGRLIAAYASTPDQLQTKLDALADVLDRARAAAHRHHAVAIRDQAEASRREIELRYRRLSESGLLGVVIARSDGVIEEANATFLDMVGRDRDDLAAGRIDWATTTAPELRAANAAIEAELHAHGHSRAWETEYVRKDGKRTPVMIGVATLERDRAITICLDLSERNSALAHKTAILERALDGIVGMDHRGIITEFNPSAEAIFGYARDEAIGRPLADLIIPPGARERHRAGLARVRASGASQMVGARIEIAAMRTDGATFPVELSIAKVAEDPPTYLGFIRDVTHRGCAESVVEHLGAAFARVWTFNAAEKALELQASAGMYTHIDGGHRRVKLGESKIGRVASARRAHFSNDVASDPEVQDPAWARRERMVAFAGMPLLVGDELVGVMAVFSRRAMTETLQEGLLSVANAVAIGVQRKILAAKKASLEDDLRQAQKMEAIGRLAGGIAHDFNNLLSVIVGYSSIALEELKAIPDNRSSHDARVRSRRYAPISNGERYYESGARLNDVASAGALLISLLTLWSVWGNWRSVAIVVGVQCFLIAFNTWITLVLLKKKSAALCESVRTAGNLIGSVVVIRMTGFPIAVWLWLPYCALWFDHFTARTAVAILTVTAVFTDTLAIASGVPLLYPVMFTGFAYFCLALSRARYEVIRSMLQNSEEQRDALERANEAVRDAHARLQEESRARVSAELELRQAQKLEAIGRLASGIAHEINTPVQFVSDSVAFLKGGTSDLLGYVARCVELREAARRGDTTIDAAVAEAEEAAIDADVDYLREHMPKAVEVSLEGLSRIATIVRSMKEFAHPDPKSAAPLDVNRALQSTLVIAANEYKLVADVDFLPADVPSVLCRGGDVNQVFLNLIVNAAHAKRAERGKITVRTRVDGDAVVVSIQDTGTGIPEEVRHRIFEPFFTTKEVGRGTGQGLAIAHSVVSQHGGALTFETALGVGTTFHVRLPLHAPALAGAA